MDGVICAYCIFCVDRFFVVVCVLLDSKNVFLFANEPNFRTSSVNVVSVTPLDRDNVH